MGREIFKVEREEIGKEWDVNYFPTIVIMSFKKGTIYVFIANIINLVISLFTGFLLPKLLSIECYSNIKLFQLYIVYLGILTLGFGDGMNLRLGGKKLNN